MTQGSEPHVNPGPLRNQALMIASCATTIATLIPVALFQTGVLDSLPDPPSRVFDSNWITQSKTAHPFGIPDALLGLASFGTTLTLILLAKKSSTARELLGAKLAIDASAAAFNATRQIVRFGKLCSWCTGTALAAGVMAFAGRENIAEALKRAKSSATQARVTLENRGKAKT